jgi:ATP-binding cassette subfamily B protein
MPVALLYVGKLIIDQVALNTNSPAGNLQELWQLVALEFALALLTDGLNRMINLTDSLLGDLFSNYTSIRIHAATLDLDQFCFFTIS